MAKDKKAKTKKITVRGLNSAKKPSKKIVSKTIKVKNPGKSAVKQPREASTVKPTAAVVSEPVMDKKEFGFYRDKLISLKDEIMSQIKEISEDTLLQSQKDTTGEASGYTMHMADVASDNYEREFNFRVVSGDRELLLEIESAIKKIESGDYGVCVMCDKTIGKSRLNVIPYAKYCRKCKEQLEKDGKI